MIQPRPSAPHSAAPVQSARALADRSAALYRHAFGARPAGVWSAPGRVNLIGEHTDYSGGLVLPFAIDARASVAIGAGEDFMVASAQRPGPAEIFTAADMVPGGRAADGWQGYALGVVWALRQRGYDVPPVRIALDSAVPVGAGLSSSAAIECAVALALSDYLELELDRPTIARIARQAENDFVGVPCGLMDQMASAASTPGHALYFDVGADSIEHIPFDTPAAGLQLLVIDTRAHHSLADGEYAKRHAQTEAAAQQLGVGRLSDISFFELEAALARLTGPDAVALRRRTRHVITENERVRTVVDLLREGRIHTIGAAITESHLSLRDDFEVSCTELNLATDSALEAGALGARMIGGGFGGSVIALAESSASRHLAARVEAAFAEAGYRAPTIRAVVPADGAHRDR